MKHPGVVLCAALFLLTSCQDLGTSYSGAFLGTFSYKAYDTTHAKVGEGTLHLYRSDGRISGHWSFVNGESGELDGYAVVNDISIDLNPQFRDSNLLLHGTLTGDVFAGTWEQIGFAGVMARGTFLAVRIR